MPKRSAVWFTARAIVGQRRANQRGGNEYLVAWEGSDEEGHPWPDSWEPAINCTQGLIDSYHSMLSSRLERKVTEVTVDISPLLQKVRASMARAVCAAQEASFGEMHEVPIEALCLEPLAMAFLEMIGKPWAFDGSVIDREPLPVETKNETHFVTYKDMEAIGEFCNFQDFMSDTGAIGALRYNTGRKSNKDAVVVGLPLQFAYKPHPSGIGTFAMRFPTVRVNGMYGIAVHAAHTWCQACLRTLSTLSQSSCMSVSIFPASTHSSRRDGRLQQQVTTGACLMRWLCPRSRARRRPY